MIVGLIRLKFYFLLRWNHVEDLLKMFVRNHFIVSRDYKNGIYLATFKVFIQIDFQNVIVSDLFNFTLNHFHAQLCQKLGVPVFIFYIVSYSFFQYIKRRIQYYLSYAKLTNFQKKHYGNSTKTSSPE